MRAVEHVRRVFESHAFTFGAKSIRVTASFGIACLPSGTHASIEELMAKADTALYTAKHNGRNKFEIAAMGEPTTTAH